MENPAAPALATWAARPPVAVAFSGGADSTVLLYAAARQWPSEVHALHVNHRLQQAAGDFESHCMAVCASLGVPLHIGRVDARHVSGESPEDAARRARYLTLAGLAQAHGIGDVLLAQHADDQVETLLIALGRGAGIDGLAGMPSEMLRHGVRFHRPLLDVPGPALRAWIAATGTPCIEDPSNGDMRYTRNRIRRFVLPALAEVLPPFRETFARSARNAARASQVLVEVAAADLALTGVPPTIASLRGLARERRANVLRHWLRSVHGAVPSEAQLRQLLDQLEACSTRGHRIHLKVAAGHVQREGEFLHWYNAAPSS